MLGRCRGGNWDLTELDLESLCERLEPLEIAGCRWRSLIVGNWRRWLIFISVCCGFHDSVMGRLEIENLAMIVQRLRSWTEYCLDVTDCGNGKKIIGVVENLEVGEVRRWSFVSTRLERVNERLLACDSSKWTHKSGDNIGGDAAANGLREAVEIAGCLKMRCWKLCRWS